ncbi:MAG: threonylcarbamoyl-AMP synthase [Candidatus Nealsonbacteria bacterium]|nr:MAG: threonylcarbamoyl-AMP synthase [Candidatus Nealsonbacteria bacterium]
MEIIKPNLGKAAMAIKEGKVLVCPTDTVYGLICDAGNKKALERLYKIKKRSRKKPIPIFVGSIRMAKKLARISGEQEEFLRKVWPGKMTVVLERKKGGTVGLRVPNYAFVLNLIGRVNRPLTGTSANISGQPASTKVKEVREQFNNRRPQPDLIIDAGNLPPSKPSTVIDLTIWPPKILRN